MGGEDASAPKPVIFDVVLAYIAHSLENSSVGDVKAVCYQHFSSEEIVHARDVFWTKMEKNEDMPKICRRHNMQTQKSIEQTVADIIAAISGLKDVPDFAVHFDDIGRLPLSKPSDICPISLCDRVAKLEARLERAEEMVVEDRHRVMAIEKDMGAIQEKGKSYAEAANSWPDPKYLFPNEKLRQQPPAHKQTSQTMVKLPVASAVVTERTPSLWSIASSKPSMHADGFEYPKDGRKKRRRRVIRGKKDDVQGLKAGPEPLRDIFVYRLARTTSAEDIDDYMSSNGMKPKSVVKVSHADSKLASFRVEVTASQVEKVLHPDSWPQNVCIRRFWKKRMDAEPPSAEATSKDSSAN